jgi:cell division topological specificity factor
MNVFNWFNRKRRRGTAPVARDRLKVLLAHEGTRAAKSDLLGLLRAEIVAVVCRHVSVEPNKVQVKMHRRVRASTLAFEVQVPA